MPRDLPPAGSVTPSERLQRNTAMVAKIKRGEVPLDLPIRLSAGDVIGSLKAVTWSDSSDPIALQRLTDWRNANMGSFLTQFTATPERTAQWLRDVALPNDRQMLFWVHSEDSIVGHLGFTSLTETDAQGDNAIRGERGGHPKLIVKAQHAMFQWLFDVCGLDTIYGQVFSDNPPALMMNRQIGFSTWQRHALSKVSCDGEDVWVVGDAIGSDPGKRFSWRVSITAKEFFERMEGQWTL